VDEELDKMAEANAKPLTNRLEIMRESVIRNAAAMVELGLRISGASRSEHELAKDIDEVISRMHKQGAELQTLGEIRGREELAILENLHQAGLIAEQDYARQRLNIEEELSKKKRKLAEDDLQAEINIRKAGAEAAEKSQPELTRAAESARNKSEAAQTEALVARSGMDTAKENLAQAKDAMREWTKGHTTELGENYARIRAGGTPDAGFSKAEFDKWERLQRDIEQGQRAMNQAPGDVAKKETAAKIAQDEYKRASDDAVDNAKLATKSKQEAARKEGELAALHKSNQELSSAEHNANQLGGPMGALATQDLQAAIRTAQKNQRHEPVSREEQGQMTALATRITGHQTGLQESLGVMRKAAQDTGTFTEDVGRLVQVMENLARNIGPIRGQIDELERQVRDLNGRAPRV
jgi:chromosome segregation ATPase